jgi:pyruvate,water dikinase
VIISLTSAEATLQAVGGKGVNLARLRRAGFCVPAGFIIPTDAYRAFVNSNHLSNLIAVLTNSITTDNPAQLEDASARIRAAFSAGSLPTEIEADVQDAYAAMNGAPVAVRSSATLEDLPDLSFAGQQDTFLNIIGPEDLLVAVIDCWSSLWTARAIGYRMRNRVNHHEATLAVVVQEMVQSEVSGVLFTANPLTGLLSETVIDATFGLGEALVSGQVEPDHFVIDSVSGAIKTAVLGTKAVSTRSKAGGGVQALEESSSARQSLTDEQIQQLVALGQQVQKEYGIPQDIEWAFAAGELYLLQSRPITSLFPIPEVSQNPLVVWFSFGAAQGRSSRGQLHVWGEDRPQPGARVCPGWRTDLDQDQRSSPPPHWLPHHRRRTGFRRAERRADHSPVVQRPEPWRGNGQAQIQYLAEIGWLFGAGYGALGTQRAPTRKSPG